jgi:hypothetical protein
MHICTFQRFSLLRIHAHMHPSSDFRFIKASIHPSSDFRLPCIHASSYAHCSAFRLLHASMRPCIHPAVFACFPSMHLCTFQRFSLLRIHASVRPSSDIRFIHASCILYAPTKRFSLALHLAIFAACIQPAIPDCFAYGHTATALQTHAMFTRTSCFSCIHLQAQRLRSMLIYVCDSRLIHLWFLLHLCTAIALHPSLASICTAIALLNCDLPAILAQTFFAGHGSCSQGPSGRGPRTHAEVERQASS